MPQRLPARPLLVLAAALAAGIAAPAALAAGAPKDETRTLLMPEDQAGQPYTWSLQDGTELIRSTVAADGTLTVMRRAGHERYLLDTRHGRLPVAITPECWKQSGAAFEECLQPGQWEESSYQKEERAERERRDPAGAQRRRARWEWTGLDLKQSETIAMNAVFNIAMAANGKLAEVKAEHFDCDQSAVSVPAIPPESAALWAQAQRLGLKGDQAEAALVAAAKLGNWRAASALVQIALDDPEDDQSAPRLVAWLVQARAPAGVNRLADQNFAGEAAQTRREEAVERGDSDPALVYRWYAAQTGDPEAQWRLAEQFAARDPELSRRLRACVAERFPDLAK